MRTLMIAAFAAFTAFSPAVAQDKTDKGKEWCTDAHMKQMDDSVAKMADAGKKKEAAGHLAMSKEAMTKKDMAGCVKHMEAAHKSMGL